MSKAARSLFAFGVYVVAVGVGFLVVPEPIMAILRLPPATAGWARMIGLLAIVIGTYDVVGARAESAPYIGASVFVRFGFAAGATLLVVAGQMPVSVLVLAAIDAASAIWTALALKANAPAAAAVS